MPRLPVAVLAGCSPLEPRSLDDLTASERDTDPPASPSRETDTGSTTRFDSAENDDTSRIEAFGVTSWSLYVQLGVDAQPAMSSFVIDGARYRPAVFVDVRDDLGGHCELAYVLPRGVLVNAGDPETVDPELVGWLRANNLVFGFAVRAGGFQASPLVSSADHAGEPIQCARLDVGPDPHAYFLDAGAGSGGALLFGVGRDLGPLWQNSLAANPSVVPPIESWTGGAVRTPFETSGSGAAAGNVEAAYWAGQVDADMNLLRPPGSTSAFLHLTRQALYEGSVPAAAMWVGQSARMFVR